MNIYYLDLICDSNLHDGYSSFKFLLKKATINYFYIINNKNSLEPWKTAQRTKISVFIVSSLNLDNDKNKDI